MTTPKKTVVKKKVATKKATTPAKKATPKKAPAPSYQLSFTEEGLRHLHFLLLLMRTQIDYRGVMECLEPVDDMSQLQDYVPVFEVGDMELRRGSLYEIVSDLEDDGALDLDKVDKYSATLLKAVGGALRTHNVSASLITQTGVHATSELRALRGMQLGEYPVRVEGKMITVGCVRVSLDEARAITKALEVLNPPKGNDQSTKKKS